MAILQVSTGQPYWTFSTTILCSKFSVCMFRENSSTFDLCLKSLRAPNNLLLNFSNIYKANIKIKYHRTVFHSQCNVDSCYYQTGAIRNDEEQWRTLIVEADAFIVSNLWLVCLMLMGFQCIIMLLYGRFQYNTLCALLWLVRCIYIGEGKCKRFCSKARWREIMKRKEIHYWLSDRPPTVFCISFAIDMLEEKNNFSTCANVFWVCNGASKSVKCNNKNARFFFFFFQ